jgi:hypothetical protein
LLRPREDGAVDDLSDTVLYLVSVVMLDNPGEPAKLTALIEPFGPLLVISIELPACREIGSYEVCQELLAEVAGAAKSCAGPANLYMSYIEYPSHVTGLGPEQIVVPEVVM